MTDFDAIRPATDLLLMRLRETVGEIQAHDHPTSHPDLYCLNLTSFIGGRMGPVLRRLSDEQAETRKWQERNTALADEFAAEAERLHAERDAMREAVNSLHQPRFNAFGQQRCQCCGGLWPCTTHKAVNPDVAGGA